MRIITHYHDTIMIPPIDGYPLNYHHYHTPLGVIVMIDDSAGQEVRDIELDIGMSTNVHAPCLRLYTQDLL